MWYIFSTFFLLHSYFYIWISKPSLRRISVRYLDKKHRSFLICINIKNSIFQENNNFALWLQNFFEYDFIIIIFFFVGFMFKQEN